MSYVLINNLTDEYIQTLIARCGFTDVTAQYPDLGALYVIKDLDGAINGMSSMDGARRWLIEQVQLMEPFSDSTILPTDQIYPDGTVVCPAPTSPYQLVQCTHDNCPFALVYSEQAATASGQVSVKTAFDILPRTHVVSDGRGGVRAAASGESAYVLGFTVSETASAQVQIILKSYFGVVV